MTGDEIWLWQVLEDGAWGSIYANIDGLSGPGVLIARNLETAHRLGLFAVAHHDRTGLPIRCVHFTNPEIIREVP